MTYNKDMDLITIDELCESLMIGRNTAYQLLNTKQIPSFRIGRVWKIPRSSVNEYIRKNCCTVTRFR